jgi:hypothetical protein
MRIRLSLFALLALMMFSALPAFSQNCALCYTQAASAGARMIQALKSGILILIIPPTLGTVGMFFVIHHRSRQFRGSGQSDEAGQDW